jgi:hypothetical protein
MDVHVLCVYGCMRVCVAASRVHALVHVCGSVGPDVCLYKWMYASMPL